MAQHQAKFFPNKTKQPKPNTDQPSSYSCGCGGAKSKVWPHKSQATGPISDTEFGIEAFEIEAFVKNIPVLCYRDSGTDLTLCLTSLIKPENHTGQCREITRVTGAKQSSLGVFEVEGGQTWL